MITYSIIQKSQLEGAHRMDAEYFQPEYFIDFTKGEWLLIGDVLSLCQYGISQAMNDEKKGYPIFKMDDINNAFLFDDTVRFADIPKAIFDQFEMKKDDLFFNRVNSEEFVGRTGIYKFENLKSVFASYLIRMQTKIAYVLPDYLNIFLNSAYGIKQIRKFARRAVNQANVNAEELKQIKIAILPQSEQEKIAILSNKSWTAFQKSKSLYAQAKNLLLEELGLNDFVADRDLYSIINFSDIQSAHRMDAEYFQRKYKRLFDKIGKKIVVKKLVEVASVKRGSLIDPRFYDDIAGTPYIRGGDFSSGKLDKNKLVYVNSRFEPKNETRVKIGDLIFALIGSVGTSALVGEGFNDSFISNNVGKIVIKNNKELLPEYFAVVLQSIVGKFQFEKEASQTAQPKISDSQVKSFYIPILPQPIQQKIAGLVRQSHESRKKAKELLEEAKHKVEELIENQV